VVLLAEVYVFCREFPRVQDELKNESRSSSELIQAGVTGEQAITRALSKSSSAQAPGKGQFSRFNNRKERSTKAEIHQPANRPVWLR
jgi:hypothetical protein